MTNELKQGDRVSVTFEGEIGLDGWFRGKHFSFPASNLEAANSVTLLTPAARPLSVGETVLVETGARRHEVVHIRGGFAWVDPLDPPNHYLGKVVLINTLSRPGPNPTPISQPQ